jgi:nitronate monooxygenase
MPRLTELVGCKLPLQGAPMGGVATGPELAAAVADAGGHGMVAAANLAPDALVPILEEVRRRTSGPFGVNFLIPFLEDPGWVSAAARLAGLVDFFYGDPDPLLVERVHEEGALAGWQVGSAPEARAAEEAGCDLLVAQGIEAGGHVRGALPRRKVFDEVRDAVQIPVLAAGGLATADEVAEMIDAGADGVRVGTRLIATHEADAHPAYIEALIAASAEDTVLTEAFSVLWPDAPHRVLRSCLEAATAFEDEIVGEIEVAGQRVPVPRLSVIAPDRRATGAVEAMCLYAGQGVGAIKGVKPAAEVVRELTAI